MKQIVRLTESELKHLIRESVNTILNETDFKQVDNLNDYIAQNNLQMRPASKFQRVEKQTGKNYITQYGKERGMNKRQIGRMIRRGKSAPLTTVASDGTTETTKPITKNDVVLNNVGNRDNKWSPDNSTFQRKYEQDPSLGGNVYKPKGGPMNAAQINEPISFTTPWGEQMNIDKGGYILQDPNNKEDVYGISGRDFHDTYEFDTMESLIRECVAHAIRKYLK